MNSLIKNLFTLDDPDSFGVKAYLRLFELFTATYTIIYAWKWGSYIPRISDVVLPLGLAHYIDVSIFFGDVMPWVLASILTLVTLAAFLFRKYSWLYLPAFFLLQLLYAIRFSLGEIPHSSNLVGFSLLGLGLGFAFFDKNRQALHFAYGFVIFFAGLGYTTAAFCKLIGTGFHWVDGAHLWLWIAEKSTDVLSAEGSYNLNLLQMIALDKRIYATLILLTGIVTEFFAFLIWWKKARPFVTLALIGMHIGIYLAMNIFFLPYMIEFVIIGFPLYILFDKLNKKFNLEHRLSVSY